MMGIDAAVWKTSTVGTAGRCDTQGLSTMELHRHSVVVTQPRLTIGTECKDEN
jgi:hypothetical protein